VKILFICSSLPYPLDQGSRIRNFHLIKQLSAVHELYLLSLVRSEEQLRFAAELQPYCREVVCVLDKRSILAKAADLLAAFADQFLMLCWPTPAAGCKPV